MRIQLVIVSLFSLACGSLGTAQPPTLDELIANERAVADPPPTVRRGTRGEPLEPLPGMKPVPGGLPDVADEVYAVKGPDDNAFRVVQYSDWRCPHCLLALPTAGMGALTTQSTLVWRNFPLSAPCNPVMSKVQEDRCALAAASICAQRQGKAPEFMDIAVVSVEGLVEGLSEDAEFAACMQDPEVAATVLKQATTGAELGIQGTPTFFVRIGNVWYDVPNGLEDLKILQGM